MLKQNSGSGLTKTLSAKRFFDMHADRIHELFETPGAKGVTLQQLAQPTAELYLTPSRIVMAARQLNDLGIGRILRAAVEQNSPEAFKELLDVLLYFVDAIPPTGVFTPEHGQAGRKTAPHTLRIRAKWEEMGRPPTTNNLCKQIAIAAFPDLNKRPQNLRKLNKSIALVRTTISRFKSTPDNPIRNSDPNSYRY